MDGDILLQAAWVAPMVGPVLPDAGVVFRGGRVAAVGSIPSLKKSWPDAVVQDAGNAVIIPGLVNAHTHLELSLMKPGQPPSRFVDWIIALMSQPISPDGMQAGIDQCLRFGVTTVGDITSQPAVTRPVLARSGLTGISFGEVRAMGQRRSFLDSRLNAASESMDSQLISPGITPHAPYSIESAGYQRCLEVAKKLKMPLTTHLAETPDEAEFLASHTGPFKELWNLLNAWDDQVPTFVGGPIRFAKTLGLLDFPTLLAHVNYCDDDELSLLANATASVVFCPRTHAFFGHPNHQWRDMLQRGINVCVGTDSCASSLNLNLVDDLRLLHRIAPEVTPDTLWQMATTRAASALGMANVGTLQVGARANAVSFPVKTKDPLLGILENDVEPSNVWTAGKSPSVRVGL